MIKIQNGDFTKIEMYNMMKGNGVARASDNVDRTLDITGYIVVENTTPAGEISTRMIVRTADGYVGTNSNFLMNDLQEIADLVGEGQPFSATIRSGRSKGGRTFLYAEWTQ